MLEGKELSFVYDDTAGKVFSHLNLSLQRGERIGLAGPSGQGKSTLARLLSGYLTPTSGSVQVDGRPHPGRGFNPVQLVFQHPEKAVNPRWRISEIVSEALGISEDLLGLFGVDQSWMSRYPHELSGGELQRVCLVRALDVRTHYLICDEMTSMLDALTQVHIWRALLDITAKRSVGMLVISHDVELLRRTCDRVVTLFR